MSQQAEFETQLVSAYIDALGTGKLDLAKQIISVLQEIGALRDDGGPGSGNWGHEGRPGHIGGSAGGGGAQNRIENENGTYTSFSKMRKSFSKEHKIGPDDLKALKERDVILVLDGRKYYTRKSYVDDIWAYDLESGKNVFYKDIKGKNARVFIPDTQNRNYTKPSSQKTEELKTRLNDAARPDSPKDADNMYREETEEIWRKCDSSTKNALVRYTGSDYEDINQALRAGNGSGRSEYLKMAERITKAIDKSELKSDSVFYRGVSTSGFEKLFGVPVNSLTPENVGNLVGRSRTENGFMSCGTVYGSGFTSKPVQMEILAPKGTKAMYVEPFSSCGAGSTDWDGIKRQTYFSSEQETLLQQRSRLTILAADYTDGKYKIKVAVMSQNPKKHLT